MRLWLLLSRIFLLYLSTLCWLILPSFLYLSLNRLYYRYVKFLIIQVCITKKIMHPNMKHIPNGCIIRYVYFLLMIFLQAVETGKNFEVLVANVLVIEILDKFFVQINKSKIWNDFFLSNQLCVLDNFSVAFVQLIITVPLAW